MGSEYFSKAGLSARTSDIEALQSQYKMLRENITNSTAAQSTTLRQSGFKINVPPNQDVKLATSDPASPSKTAKINSPANSVKKIKKLNLRKLELQTLALEEMGSKMNSLFTNSPQVSNYQPTDQEATANDANHQSINPFKKKQFEFTGKAGHINTLGPPYLGEYASTFKASEYPRSKSVFLWNNHKSN